MDKAFGIFRLFNECVLEAPIVSALASLAPFWIRIPDTARWLFLYKPDPAASSSGQRLDLFLHRHPTVASHIQGAHDMTPSVVAPNHSE